MSILATTQLSKTVEPIKRKDETFSNMCINYIEEDIIGGFSKTKIYTYINTDFKVGDKLFLVNGNYCSYNIIQSGDIYNKYATGYTVLKTDDKTGITIDLEYNSAIPLFNTVDFNNEDLFTKVYIVNSDSDITYYDNLVDNNYTNNVSSDKVLRIETVETSPNTFSMNDVIVNNTGSIIPSSIPSVDILPGELYTYINDSNTTASTVITPDINLPSDDSFGMLTVGNLLIKATTIGFEILDTLTLDILYDSPNIGSCQIVSYNSNQNRIYLRCTSSLAYYFDLNTFTLVSNSIPGGIGNPNPLIYNSFNNKVYSYEPLSSNEIYVFDSDLNYLETLTISGSGTELNLQIAINPINGDIALLTVDTINDNLYIEIIDTNHVYVNEFLYNNTVSTSYSQISWDSVTNNFIIMDYINNIYILDYLFGSLYILGSSIPNPLNNYVLSLSTNSDVTTYTLFDIITTEYSLYVLNSNLSSTLIYTFPPGPTPSLDTSFIYHNNAYYLSYDAKIYKFTQQVLTNSLKVPVSYLLSQGTILDKHFVPMEEDILLNSIDIEKGKAYIIDDLTMNIPRLDITFEQAFITKSHFVHGTFQKGTFNDGIFGCKEKNNTWDGTDAVWKNGVLYSSNIINAVIESKSDKITKQNYYTLLENGLPKVETDFTNNKGNGYNYIIESTINDSNINNGNVINCIIGNIGIGSMIGGSYINCDIDNSNLVNTTLRLSNTKNSYIDKSLVKDTYIEYSDIVDSTIDNIGDIRILDYEKDVFEIDNNDLLKIGITHKFYISDNDLLKFEKNKYFNLSKILTNNTDRDIETIFDREYYIGMPKQIIDVNGFNNGYTDFTHEVIVDIKPRTKNKYNYKLSRVSPFIIQRDNVSKYLNSIDVTYIISYEKPGNITDVNDPGNNYTDIYNNIIATNRNFNIEVTNINNSRIVLGKLKQVGLINSTITNLTSEILPEYKVSINDSIYDIDITVIDEVTIEVDLKIYDSRNLFHDDIIQVGDKYTLTNFKYIDGASEYDLTDIYTVDSFDPVLRKLLLTKQTALPTLSSIPGTVVSNSLQFTDHALSDIIFHDNNFIKGGRYKRLNIQNSTIFNNSINTTNYIDNVDLVNINNLRISNSIFGELDNCIIDKSFIHKSSFSNIEVKNSFIYSSLLLNVEFNNGYLYRSFMESSIFNNGQFRGGNLVVGFEESDIYFVNSSRMTYSDFSPNSLIVHVFTNVSSMLDCIFNNGEFTKSIFNSRTIGSSKFNNGDFYNAIWNRGTWNNGIFGKKELTNDKTQFIRGDWNNGIFDSGFFGLNSNYTLHICNWYNGTFNNGIFQGGIDITLGDIPSGNTIWHNGTFNNGEISGSAIWKDGIFNNGWFRSFYGTGMGSDINNYSWQGGIFNNGEFGDIHYQSDTTWNSTWYTGTFNGGIFRGKVWNDGVFTGGTFKGLELNGIDTPEFAEDSQTSATEYPEHMVLSFSVDSVKKWYGLWRNGIVTETPRDLNNDTQNLTNIGVALTKGSIPQGVNFTNCLWVSGTFNATSGSFINSIWLSGTFKSGRFLSSNFNPYVARWDFSEEGGGVAATLNQGIYRFDLTNDCIWENGYLDNSKFYISEWKNGLFNYGDAYGAHITGGVANYMNAYNCIWENARWRNGNWYGADFDVANSFTYNSFSAPTWGSNLGSNYTFWETRGGTSNITKDIIVHQMRRLGKTEVFSWNVINGDTGDYVNEQQTTPHIYTTQALSGGYTLFLDYPVNNNLFSMQTSGTNFNDSGETTQGNLLDAQIELGTTSGIVISTYLYGLDTNFYKVGGYNTYLIILDRLSLSPNHKIVDSYDVIGTEIFMKLGNGVFKSGIWENGVWNNGYRGTHFDSEPSYIFDSVLGVQVDRNTWQVALDGSNYTHFNVGDDIAIGNIVGININGDRQLLRNRYKVISVDSVNERVNCLLTTTFPLRTIEQDSKYHQIVASKNIWMSGVFLNGVFEGIWNNGYVKGHPFTTRFENTYWIDGTFDGGHFKAENDTVWSSAIMQNITKLYTNIRNKSIVSPVNNPYRTWIDVNFVDTSGYNASDWTSSSLNFDDTIQGNTNPYLNYNQITYDILSSSVRMVTRPNVEEDISMGWKYKEYENFIEVEGKFDAINKVAGVTTPLADRGWLFYEGTSTINSVPGDLISDGSQFKVYSDSEINNPTNIDLVDETGYALNYLNIDIKQAVILGGGKFFIGHQNQNLIPNNRYIKVDLSVLLSGRYDGSNTPTNQNDIYITPFPMAQEGEENINRVVYSNYTYTPTKYFYNHPKNQPFLAIRSNSTNIGLQVDDIRIVEIDMIPFMRYHRGHIDNDIQIPFSAIAPFINYDDSDFSFVSNVVFGVDGNVSGGGILPPIVNPPIFTPDPGGGSSTS